MPKRPDGMEISLRIGCGALFGLLLGLPIAWRFSRRYFESEATLVPMIVGSVRTTARRLPRLHPLRSADALQLAAAIVCSEREPGTLPFVCLDKRLADAPRREGFRVIEPA